MPKYAALAATVQKMVDGGANLTNIATTLGETYDTVRNALVYARSGVRPKTKPAGKPTGTRTGPPKFTALASEIARLRDEEHVPFAHIAVRLKISEPTVRRAYDYAHRDEVSAAVLQGKQANRGRYVRVSMDQRREVLERLNRGEEVEVVASAVGCSVSTVRRISREK